MSTLDVMSIMNLIFPILTVIGIAYRYRYTRRRGLTIMIPSLIYMAFYYGVFILCAHFVRDFEISSLQIPFRIGIIFITLSLLIYVVSDTISLRNLIEKYNEDIEEKYR